MPINIEMPQLSDTMTEGTLVQWLKQPGDEIEIGDIIAEIETDKATMEMEAFDDGTLADVQVAAGEKVAVGTVLAILLEEGEEAGDAPAASSSANEGQSETPATAEAPAAETSKSEAKSAPPAPVADDGERLRVSPLARKIAAERGVELGSVKGTGPGGRIVKADVIDAPTGAATKASASPAPSKAPAATSAAAPNAIMPVVGDEDTVTPLSSMRRIIADRLLASKVTIPHFYLHVELDAAPLMAMRKQVNAQAESTHGNKYSVNDFILKATIAALGSVPEVNASFNGDSIVQFKHVGLSVAIAVDDGLVTPVIREAESKSLLEISKSVKDLAARARDKKLKPNEFDGGTITVSNLGSYGIDSFDAIVNPPQAAILSVGGISEKPVVKNGEIVPGLRMNLGLSCDHRVVDGAVAAVYLNEVKKLIENPTLMLI